MPMRPSVCPLPEPVLLDPATDPMSMLCQICSQDALARLRLGSTPDAVRQALQDLTQTLSQHVSPDAVGTVEIVVAEVLNNIVEHAYEEAPDGQIDILVGACGDGLAFAISDRGCAMPGGEVPEGRQADLDVETDALPEGGFGWFMIHTLTRNLTYRRERDGNCLCFEMPLDGDESRLMSA